MRIKFFGVRGSMPAPGPTTTQYGGNTSCVHVSFENGEEIILDAGTGLRELGYSLVQSSQPVNLVLSHNHWDHIQGYPFFGPLYQPGRLIRVYDRISSAEQGLCSMFDQMDGISFPVRVRDLPSESQVHYSGLEEQMSKQGIEVISKELNHPGGGCAFKLASNQLSCAYVTDNELQPPNQPNTSYDQWVEYLHKVDVLIHDAQYTEDDMPHKHGWGHSLISQVRQLALDAEVGTLVMFHHDPQRTDGELDEVKRENEIFFRSHTASTNCFCAYEGLEIELAKSASDGRTMMRVL
ncbi:MAG: phosphoribosyl 1,2-cyclic phosphodiesterase [Parasphingorhabdus sp.]|jgi:phosphoribosyl 1,2-cyclic phosphodiesterase